MNIDKLENIKISLMESIGTLDEENKTEYEIKGSANFIFTDEIKKEINDSNIHLLVKQIYEELFENLKSEKIDSVGVWINYDNLLFENSMKTATIEDMEKYGADDLSAIYEFCKMTIMDS